jgi:hypothetical protein
MSQHKLKKKEEKPSKLIRVQMERHLIVFTLHLSISMNEKTYVGGDVLAHCFFDCFKILLMRKIKIFALINSSNQKYKLSHFKCTRHF